jgi:two-component system, NtrC family, response regulator AtoC
MLTILIVDDEPDLCSLIAETLRDEGHTVTCARDGAEAMALIGRAKFDVVLADVRLPRVDGVTLFRRLRVESPSTDMILMTGHAAVADAVAVLKEGAFDYLTKPIQMEELSAQFARIATYRGLHREVEAARAALALPAHALDRLVGHSPEMQRLVKRVEAIAHSDASVVITGESGTGKELVAHALHDLGGRKGKRFVAVNCAAFPDTLIEAELFGHERGAFTDATGRRDGRFVAANGGTLFLDEVAELSPAAQAKLLRVLQEGVVEPLGSNQSVQVDVRVISATHRDLRQRIADGLFRADLYYRINTIDLAIPPLRERAGDLAILVKLFMERFASPDNPNPGITFRAWSALAAYPFPGNVRELMHTVQHATVLAAGGQIDLEHLPSSIRGGRSAAVVKAASQMAPLRAAAQEFERGFLLRALAEADGRRIKAAEALGISRKNLWEKLRAHGIADAQDDGGSAVAVGAAEAHDQAG